MKTYLGGGGRTFGPYDEAAISRMRASGEIDRFHWIWRESSREWKPVDAPPPPPEEFRAKPTAKRALRALCLDLRATRGALGGVLENLNSSGGEIVGPRASAAAFAPDARVLVNAMDPETGETWNLPARLLSASPTLDGWVYRFRWESELALPAQLAV